MTVVSFQLYPVLDSATESALRASIQRFGVLVPIVVSQTGEILDGHHRSRIAGELGVEFETRVVEVADEVVAREVARTLNEDRRMLTREQRLPVVVALREEGHSQRAIAGALGVPRRTVRDDLTQVGGAAHLPAETTGLDGKTYPASKPKPPVPSGGTLTGHDTPRQRQLASNAKERIERAIGTCNGIARGFDHLNVQAALFQTTDDELAGWHEALRDATVAIKRLQTRLKEARP